MNISPACAEGDCFPALFPRADRGYSLQISIHALFAEGDRPNQPARDDRGNFYPRPLRRGRPEVSSHNKESLKQFLSTPSSQRATSARRATSACSIYFYPRPLRRGRQNLVLLPVLVDRISIHALFAEGDSSADETVKLAHISIHALFAEGDRISDSSSGSLSTFLSTPSSQRATAVSFSSTAPMAFLSTPSSQRATGCDRAGVRHRAISIHALFAEGDNELLRDIPHTREISIHALFAEGDAM